MAKSKRGNRTQGACGKKPLHNGEGRGTGQRAARNKATKKKNK